MESSKTDCWWYVLDISPKREYELTSAFLLNNGATYWYSHAIGLAEYFISSYFWPAKYEHFFTSFPFLFIGKSPPSVVANQLNHSSGFLTLRPGSPVTSNDPRFRFLLSRRQSSEARWPHSDHSRCIRVSPYDSEWWTAWRGRYSRHPSYCGFFYWAVMTQVLLGNVASTIAFVFILGKFFVNRIRGTSIYANQSIELTSRWGDLPCEILRKWLYPIPKESRYRSSIPHPSLD